MLARATRSPSAVEHSGRLDMPDLYRVASKLLKKGGTAPR
jgi:hypothetical protein